ncbi:MAG: GNAT family N-acetyltransferase [Gemmataceae bacterium]|nr:GNAT family N-acetyltransferase [Gemmataceae bacterium]
MKPRSKKLSLVFHPLTLERWDDFELLFGPRGACAGCWCMLWRLTRSEFDRQKGDGNRQAMHDLVAAGAAPGILTYHDGRPIGWCAVAPRAEYPALARSRVLKPIDDAPVWSISCLFVAKGWRNRGVSVELLKAAAAHARRHGGKVVEGYPVEPRQPRMPDVFAWTGVVAAFRRAGFVEAARGSATRPIMRCATPVRGGRTVKARRSGRSAAPAARKR